MAAAIHLDRSPLPEKVEGTGSGEDLSNFQRDKVQLFCESMNEIERLRNGQVERLKRALQVDDFPSNINISDPTLLPFLNPKVRAVVEAFPLQAEAIVKKHGLESDEFNQMLHASKSNPIFRWKVQKHLKLESSAQEAEKKDENAESPSSGEPQGQKPRAPQQPQQPVRQDYNPQPQQQRVPPAQRQEYNPQRTMPPQRQSQGYAQQQPYAPQPTRVTQF